VSTTPPDDFARSFQEFIAQFKGDVPQLQDMFLQLRSLSALVARLSGAVSQDDVCRAIIDSAIEALGAYAGGVLLLNDARSVLELCEAFGYPEAITEAYKQIPIDSVLPATEAVRTGAPVFFQNREEVAQRYPGLLAAGSETQSGAALPLIAGEHVIGVLTLAFRMPRPFETQSRTFMESLAHECARALDRARLYEREKSARADAEAANRAKDEFLAMLSHELRTPLNAILGWAHILGTAALAKPAADRALETIVRNAKLQARMVEELLDLSRIITGKLYLDVQEVYLGPILSQIVEATRPAAEAKRITVRTFLDPEVGPVLGDPDRLQQAIWNLVSNAIKFTPKGGAVEVKLDRVSSNARISIADNGEGIADDVLPFIFDRFTQGDSSPRRHHYGLGLGLAIVRHLVEAHGGSVSAHSDGPGHGALFTVRLPLVAVRKDLPEPAVLPSGPPTPGLAGLRILVVEDEVDSRELMVRLLTTYGAEAHGAGTADEAIACVETQRPDVLLSDIGLPGGDGYALMRRIRARDDKLGLARLPAAALTAYATAEDRKLAMLAGFNIHLSKPIDVAELVAVVLSLVGRTGGA
jgi:signal transduction histidine kinase